MNVHDTNYIGGSWQPSTSTEFIPVVNPATGEEITKVVAGTTADVDAAVDAAAAALPAWSATSVEDRAKFLSGIADGITERLEAIAGLLSSEIGAPIEFARAVQVPLAINSFSHAAVTAAEFDFEYPEGNSTIVHEPFGVVGAITPWNYPLFMVAEKVAYALAAGNTVVLKPSEVAPLSIISLVEIFESVGVPAGVLNVVFGTGPVVGEAIAAHPEVGMVTFTGSTRAGRRVAELAAPTVKRVTLELGGKSPTVVLEGTDLSTAIPAAVQGAMMNSGQTCSALTRLVVPRDKQAEVESIVKATLANFTVGDPSEDSTVLGPLVSATQQRRVLDYIERGKAEGARVVTGGGTGRPHDDQGAYVEPTVFADVDTSMVVHQEEIFGPVLVIEPYDDEADAERIANDSVYGLAAAVWAGDSSRAHAFARRIKAGQVMVNGADFDPNAPFGGYKQSGVGRQAGRFGLLEFLEVKALQG
ncbi:aldehyde dehydrogenase family protein [Gordonia sp. KTR9]|uniref:aldehyde dehydrogenase family protein n=1 Tax=Gordonia sp. KTR9 TaxID=337191 RepID=UPI00027DE6B0|nr:aldehyde dehydrogenase family protein [Gordonia sp. KTR9]AFR50952.1 putative 6-oxohexanoate dehydrogenase [Gordonia sp. KTR9]